MANNDGVKTDFLSFLTKHSKKITIFLVLFCMISIAAAGITYWQYREAAKKNAAEAETFTEEQVQTAKVMEAAAGKIVTVDGNKLSVALSSGETKEFTLSEAASLAKGEEQEAGSVSDLGAGTNIAFAFDSTSLTILNISY